MATIKFDSEKQLYILSSDFEYDLDERLKFKTYDEAYSYKDYLEIAEECGGFGIVLKNEFYYVVQRNCYPVSLERIAGYYNSNTELMDIEHTV